MTAGVGAEHYVTGTRLLAINAGSSSIKFAMYDDHGSMARRLEGHIDRIGAGTTTLRFRDRETGERGERPVAAGGVQQAVSVLLDWLDARPGARSIRAVGHRLVHGMDRVEPELVTDELLAALHRIEPFVPNHLPAELRLIEAFRARDPRLPQVVCFDTAFHQSMPRVARVLALPRRFEAQGVRRYGFHGLSCAYLMEELERLAGADVARGRTILAHLGSGASLAAVLEGKSIDTSMGFTPASGLPMATRSGDLDPELGPFLSRTAQMTDLQFSEMINHASGLLGISETSGDVRDLLEHELDDVRAAEAVALFCYQAKKGVGAYAAALGGLDTLVFAGGIGENSARIRDNICAGLEFIGLELCPSRNVTHAEVISTDASRVTVRVIPTDEESMIAKGTRRVMSGLAQ